ncbi:MAG: YraN family protein [Chloroflexota bacterium]
MDPQPERSRTPGQRAGDAAEALVAARLAAAGWTVLGRNVRVGRGELDLVAVDPGPPRELVVVEVRWRSGREFGLGEETVGWRKRRTLRDAGYGLLDRQSMPGGEAVPRLGLRFDLVIVEPGTSAGAPPRVRHHRNALGT